MEPIMLQPTMSAQSEERPGLFGRVRDFFTTDDPNAGQATDPFAGLSRAQRTMLGFAALRDAAASLEGRDSNFFQTALGGFESARERERLRAQGVFQNQVAAMQALGEIENSIAARQSLGFEPTPSQLQLREMLYASVSGGGMPSPTVIRDGATVPTPAGGGMASPGDFMGGTLPTGGLSTATGPIPGDQYLAEMERTGEIGVDAQGNLMPEGAPAPEAPAPAASPMGDLDAQEAAIYEQMRDRMVNQAPTRDLELQLQAIQQQREAMAESDAAREEEIAGFEASAAQAEGVVLPEVDQALNFLVQGFDAEGNVIFNPALVTRAGRLISGALEGPEYQNFVGAIETLKTGVLLDALSRATVGALSEGEMRALSAEQGMLDPANPIGTFRALNNIQRIAQQSIERRNREAGNAPAASVPSVNWD